MSVFLNFFHGFISLFDILGPLEVLSKLYQRVSSRDAVLHRP